MPRPGGPAGALGDEVDGTDLSSLLIGENADFLDGQYLRWVRDPASVDARWRALFESMQDEPVNGARFEAPGPDRRTLFRGGAGALDAAAVAEIARRQTAVVQLINAWRVRGHFKADIDPLKRTTKREHPELTLTFYGLGPDDAATEVPTAPLRGVPAVAPIGTIVEHLERVYGGTIGAEFMNIDDLDQKRWVQERLEALPHRKVLDRDSERRFLRKITDAEIFERTLHQRFPGTKRFSLEGGETLLPLLDLLTTQAAAAGVKEIVLGMAHRGRLNVLTNLLEKPFRVIAEEFQDSSGRTQGSGDVKYHLGYSSDIVTPRGDEVHLSLTPNPSHLEAVNPVVEGRVRAKQDRFGDRARSLSMPVLLHGDAAFIGQGSVAEVLQLAELDGYACGGTIHVVVNNQIGFTTAPRESRSTPYATDMARMMAIPIFHVNGEDPEAVAAVVEIAVEWRQRFRRDIVIDMYCYRKHGHNEGDEPSFTQPLMYDEIRRRPTPREMCARRLTQQGLLTPDDVERALEDSRRYFELAGAPAPELAIPPGAVAAEEKSPVDPDLALYRRDEAPSAHNAAATESVSPLKGRWMALTDGRADEEVDTSYDIDLLVPLLVAANTIPPTFHPHAKVARLIEQRLEMANGRRSLDWAMAEQAAFATLVADGFRVRLSGQDSARGTFSQRHAVWTDVHTGEERFPLEHLAPDQAPFHVIDSNLSELAVLGYEYGYSLDMPDALVAWEAQFGDFCNGAQVIIDQFIAPAEQKWGRMSGLVMLLPHGYEGQGPEHSSARLERWLQLCAQDNMQVVNITTPANYFHLLRRQVIRHVRKPLVVMTPKSLLRHAECTSPLDDLGTGRFRKVIPDPRGIVSPERIVLCSGHVYFDLLAALPKYADAGRIAIHRVEQLYPFPWAEVSALLAAAPEADVVWCQEEPRNMGAWSALTCWFAEHLPPGRRTRYVGRPAAASPATGSYRKHNAEQTAFITEALTL
jgi:2-oxoglutarate dehydrogenase E1 component